MAKFILLRAPADGLDEVVDVLLDVGEDGGQGIVVGGAVDVERPAEEMARAVGGPELVGAGHILPLEVVGGAVNAVLPVDELLLVDAGGVGVVVFEELERGVHLPREVFLAMQLLVGEEDIALVVGIADVNPFLAPQVFLPHHGGKPALLESEGQRGGVVEGVGMLRQVDAQVGLRLRAVVARAAAGGEEN